MKSAGLIFGLLASAAALDMGVAFAETMTQADMLARLEPADHALAATPIFAEMDYPEARKFFESKKVMQPDELAALEDLYRAKGFSMAGVHSRYVLETAHQALTDAIARGRAESEITSRLKQAFADAGLESPTDFHLQTAFDSAVLGSYAAGRYAQLTKPEVLAARPIWQYRTVGDSRVRPAHAAMNGRAFLADAAVWQVWYPPNGYKCRCGITSLSHDEAKARGIHVEGELPRIVEHEGQIVNMQPDPGWAGSPATQITADRTVAEIRASAERTGVLGQGPNDLNRAADAERRQQIDRFSGIDHAQAKALLEETPVFNVHVEDAAQPPQHGQLAVDWHMYSQNLDSAEQLVTRLVQTPGLYGLKDRISVAARATYFGEWDPINWPDPEVVYDDQLARELGRPEGKTVARSTEYALRMHLRPSELTHLLAFLDGNGERGPGKTPVRRAWEVQDVRVRAGEGAELPSSDRWRPAWRNSRALPSGKEQVTLSRAPMEGWAQAPVVVNASLWDFLP